MPIRTYNSADQKVLDTDEMDYGVCIGTLAALPGTSAVRSFPSLNGLTLLALSSINGNTQSENYVTYPGGVPTVTLAPAGSAGRADYVTLWVYGTRTVSGTSGVSAQTPSGTIAVGPETYGLHHAGQAVFDGHVASWGNRDYGVLGYSVLHFDSPTPPAVVARIQSGESVSVNSVAAHPSIPGRWLIHARCTVDQPYPAWAALQVPVLHCYTRKQYAVEPTGTVKVFEQGGTDIAWSLGEPGLLYPVRVMSVAHYYGTAVPGGMTLGVCGSPRGYQINVDEDPENFPPLWHIAKYHTAAWRLDGTALQVDLQHSDTSEPMDGPGSPVYQSALSQAIVVNVGGL